MVEQRSCPIAIVGWGGRFPGGPDVETFWRNVAAGRDAGREVPAGRWMLSPDQACTRGEVVPDKTYSTWGCYLDEIRLPEELRQRDRELIEALDPVCHLALATAQDALSSAQLAEVDRRRIGVILGHIVLPTEATSAMGREVVLKAFEETLLRSVAQESAIKSQSAWHPRNRRIAALPAELIAEWFGLGGTAYTLDAACASSLYALKLAIDELQAGRADAMLAGGLSRPDCQYTQIGFAQLGALSKRGCSAPLSVAADGLVVGEGAGFFVLKRLDDAVATGDRIEGVIAGIGLSNDRGANLLAPHSEGQLRAMRAAYEQAGWSPEDVDYIECHATGTPTGDAVELDSLHQLWADRTSQPGQCVLGAVKSNVGHLLTGAGGAGLMKILGMLRSRELWPIANFEQPATALQKSGSPFRVVSEAEPWREAASGRPRRAAINAFGFGGINAHVLIEEWNQGATNEGRESIRPKAEEIVIVGVEGAIGPWKELAAIRARLFGQDVTSPQSAANWGVTGDEDLPAFGMDQIEIPVGEFRIPPRELPDMLPQQQLMLQVTARALDRTGIGRSLGDRAGVFVGVSLDPNTTNFHSRWAIAEQARGWTKELGYTLTPGELAAWTDKLQDAFGPPLTPNRVMGNLAAITASRIAREFDVGGPSFTISADEASGLRALEAAIGALERRELDLAIVGAVEFESDVRAQRADHDKISDAPAHDGAAVFLLKRRTDADEAGDRILARIAIDEDVKGTSSSIRERVGFGLATDGLMSVLQTTLCVSERISPEGTPWLADRRDGPRRISVPSGGGRGLVIEEAHVAREKLPAIRAVGVMPQLLVIEGDDQDELRAALEELEVLIGEFSSIGAAAQKWRERKSKKTAKSQAIVVVGREKDELRAAVEEAREVLRAGSEGGSRSGRVFYARRRLGLAGRLAFVFPGSGNAFLGMGRELLAAFPGVLQQQHAENEQLRGQYRPELIWDGESTEAIGRDHKAMIFGQVSIGTAICDLLAAFGVRPTASVGYSLGESAALFGLRVWRDRDEMLERMRRSPLFGSDLVEPFDAARKCWEWPADQPVPWVSGVVYAPVEAVRKVVQRKLQADLLIINTPNQCVIGGEEAQVREAAHELGAAFFPFNSPSSVHCPVLKEVSRDYVALHHLPTTPPPGIDFYSSATGERYGLSREAAAGAILAQAVATVDFPRVIQNAYRDGVRLFLEIGPGNSCTRMIDEILPGAEHWAGAACPATSDPVVQFVSILAQLVAHGVPIDLSPLSGDEQTEKNDVRAKIVTPVGRGAWEELPMPVIVEPQIVERCEKISEVESVSMMSEIEEPLLAPRAGESVAFSAANSGELMHSLGSMLTERAAAHGAFLQYSQRSQELAARLIAGVKEDEGDWGGAREGEQEGERDDDVQSFSSSLIPSYPRTLPRSLSAEPPRALNYEQCLEFAIGKIGDVLGPKFAEIDQFPTRVRLPDVPLMLVDRILEIEGEPLSMTHGRVVTEHDIDADDWYLDCGRIPTCIAVESGQADLFLSGWLGIDLETRGQAVYRLLDAVVTFHDALPGPGKTIHYDIRISRFFRQGETWLFRFEFDATVDGRPLLTMREGCAGFFSEEELSAGKGVVQTTLDRQPRPGKRPADWVDPVPMRVESYTDQQLTALRRGDLAACFGAAFANLPLRNPVTLPEGRMRLVDRVLNLDPTAGKYGLGMIRAEADIHPDDWFLTCHFCDDQVMPGTLMYECCLHTLRIYLLRMGWIGEAGEIAYEPIPEVRSRLKCRGQVLATTTKVWYEVTLKEIGYGEGSGLSAFCLADALMYADGKPIVEITDMSVRLTGLTRETVERLWGRSSSGGREPLECGVETGGDRNQGTDVPRSEDRSRVLFDTDRITEFAIGKPSKAFGERYRVFDEERAIARLPGPPFQFLDRITSIKNCEPWKLAGGGVIVAEYDVPADAWYFAANRQTAMPFAVLLETALQPCGWLAGYLGSALTSDVDLSFRNLGGKATQFRAVTADSGTLTTEVKITSVSQSGGMIIQHYEFDLRCRGEPVYQGKTYFGFFSKEALANQIGIRDAAMYQPTAAELSRAESFTVPLDAPFPNKRFRMVDRVTAFVPNGGPQGLGYLRGTIAVDPSAWFFEAHFYQDPVWPGSLGLESFLQLLKLYAVRRWGDSKPGLSFDQPSFFESDESPANQSLSRADAALFQTVALNAPHEWVYRGQVIPRDKTVTVDVVITGVDDEKRQATASGFLSVDSRVIYEMKEFSIDMTNGKTQMTN